jgi:hypothetical protein
LHLEGGGADQILTIISMQQFREEKREKERVFWINIIATLILLRDVN